jgi:hypothetical protein
MRKLALVCGLSGLLMLAAPLAVAQHDEGPPEQVLANALSETKNPEGVFRIEGDKAVHVQSGLRCPAYLGNAFLFEIYVFDSPAGHGMDVGCDYGRRAAPGSGKAAAKHTIYAVKLPAGGSLDTAFEQYRNEMRNTAPRNARVGGPSLTFTEPLEGFPKFRSEELFYQNGEREWQTEVIVAIQGGWIIEMRSTRVSQYALANVEEGMDQTRGVQLFFNAVFDLGGPDYRPDFEFTSPDPEAEPSPP